MDRDHSGEKHTCIQRISKFSPCVLPTKTKQIHQAFSLQTVSVCTGATRHHSKHTHGNLELVYYDGNGYHKLSQLPVLLAPL